MPNHVHLILVPDHSDALRAALSKVHRVYAGRIHAREKRTRYFWQGRFGCVAMDEPHLLAALRYVALNPVRARLVRRARDWRWSSTSDFLDRVETLLGRNPRPAKRWPKSKTREESGNKGVKCTVTVTLTILSPELPLRLRALPELLLPKL